ncbi:hypothetical protein [Adoxophyes orana nucleopolyhedrovirus]|uniref:hypothetical protein n=1 Tax=Adoxophyes orana nucleopolyhedrovirus TaxID=542343 RepID=UPI0001829C2D|nr:hypothetical protein [Adoxophyes orana nucleopolyhedrovirus]ACF05386.1 hypothetical protein [Adoxophyes orana nucleopolyhedrovirus]
MFKSNSWCVYIIRMPNGRLYTGMSNRVLNRFRDHCNGRGAKCLRGKTPLALVYKTDACLTRKEAARLEIHIKNLSKKAKEKIIATQPKKRQVCK